MPISPDEFLENARRSGRFSRAGIAAGVVRKKKWAKLACAEIITTPIFFAFRARIGSLKKTSTVGEFGLHFFLDDSRRTGAAN